MKTDRVDLISTFPIAASRTANAIRSHWIRRLAATLGLCAGLVLSNAQAAFQVLDDFDSLTLGNINGQNSWFDTDNSGQVVVDPDGGTNQTLVVNTESAVLHRAVSVAQNTSRMLFLRFRFEEHGAYSFGLSPMSNPVEYVDFGAELGMAAATTGDPNNDLRVANGSTVNVYDVLETLTPSIWYNVWVRVDTSSSTYQVWLNADPGGAADNADLLDNDAAETVFGFRTIGAGDLQNFFIKTGGGSSPVGGRFYLDDIYLEDTDTVNLNNPAGSGGDVDSNGDGISDADAIALSLDPDDPDGDTDNDGQTDVIEIGGDIANPLDSDVDGVIDALEPGATALNATVASGLPLPNGTSVTITTAAGELLSQVSAAAVTDAPTGINFPFGSISYTTTAPTGGSVTVQMAFSADLPLALSLYKQDNAGVLTELPTSVWTLVNPARVDITLTDGDAATDLDAVANGFIVDPVAPAAVTDVTPPSDTDSNGDGISDADAIALGLDPDDPDGDTDNDGQTDVIEIGGDIANPLDNDVDGVIDALEPGTTAIDAAVASGVPLPNGAIVTITTAAGEMLSQVSAAAVTDAPTGISFPFGSISYTTTAPVGGSVTVQMAFSADLPLALSLYKQDNAGVLTELPTSVWTLVNPARVDITLTDGDAATDLDAVANGFIVDPVAPAAVTDVTAPSVSTSDGGGGGCVLRPTGSRDIGLPLMLVVLFGYAWSRKRERSPLRR